MPAELVAVEGSLLGNRYALGIGVQTIGSDPSSTIRLPGQDGGWRHCVVTSENGRYLFKDLRSGSGSYINGLKVTEHWLEDGDQISIGSAVLLYRSEAAAPMPDSSRVTLLRACALLFLFRALAQAQEPAQQKSLETHLLRLIGDLAPCRSGFVLIAKGEADLIAQARERAAQSDFPEAEAIVTRLCAEGPFADPASSCVACPLFVGGVVAGAVVVRLEAEEAALAGEHYDTLSAIATLAITALEGAREMQTLRVENALLQEQLGVAESGILGNSPAIARLLRMVERVAPRETTVLILGESGTGKELVARAIHQNSPRRRHPLVAINCAALTETLLESELFGHEKGAFTGAAALKKGKLEMAEGGTVFLDEIGELAPALQAKLLRVLQQREFERVGGTRTRPLDVRLIAATNRDLGAEARRGVFREDLYHRLNVVSLLIPPLRERGDDILLLARAFLERIASRCRPVAGLTQEAERRLMRYSWPGNVRELENAIERAVVLGESDWIEADDLPETVLAAVPSSTSPGAFQDMVGDAKRDCLLQAWAQANGDYKAAAQLLGLHPNSLLRLIRQLGIRDLLRKST